MWIPSGESHPKRSKTQTSAGKVLASVFWDAQGILFIDYLEKGRTINSEYYLALLVCLKEKITKNSHKWRKSALSRRQCSVSQRQNYMNCTSNCFRTHPVLQVWHPWLLAVCRPQKNAPGEEIWLQWRSDIGNWGVFWGQKHRSTKKAYYVNCPVGWGCRIHRLLLCRGVRPL